MFFGLLLSSLITEVYRALPLLIYPLVWGMTEHPPWTPSPAWMKTGSPRNSEVIRFKFAFFRRRRRRRPDNLRCYFMAREIWNKISFYYSVQGDHQSSKFQMLTWAAKVSARQQRAGHFSNVTPLLFAQQYEVHARSLCTRLYIPIRLLDIFGVPSPWHSANARFKPALG